MWNTNTQSCNCCVVAILMLFDVFCPPIVFTIKYGVDNSELDATCVFMVFVL